MRSPSSFPSRGPRAASALVGIALSLSGAAAGAGHFALPGGRSVALDDGSILSVEAGLAVGKIDAADYQHSGVRIGYRPTPALSVSGSVGRSSVGSPGGSAYGVGASYATERLLPGFGTALAVGYARVGADSEARRSGGRDPIDCAIDNQLFNDAFNAGPFIVPGVAGPPQENCGETAGRGARASGGSRVFESLSMELVLSGREALTTRGGVRWYANAGIHRLDVPSGADTRLGVGGGLVGTFGRGELWFAADFVEGLTAGVGFRYRVN